MNQIIFIKYKEESTVWDKSGRKIVDMRRSISQRVGEEHIYESQIHKKKLERERNLVSSFSHTKRGEKSHEEETENKETTKL